MKGFFRRGNFLKKVSPAPLQKLSERWIEALRGCLLTPGVGAAVCVLGPPPKTHSRKSYFSVGPCEKTFATVFPCYVNKAYMREVFPTPLQELSRRCIKVSRGSFLTQDTGTADRRRDVRHLCPASVATERCDGTTKTLPALPKGAQGVKRGLSPPCISQPLNRLRLAAHLVQARQEWVHARLRLTAAPDCRARRTVEA